MNEGPENDQYHRSYFLDQKKKRKKILNASFYFELRQTKIQASATSEVNIA